MIAKKWKQPTCVSTDAESNKMWYIHTMEHLFSHKKESIDTF